MEIRFETKGRDWGSVLDSPASVEGLRDLDDRHSGPVRQAINAAFRAVDIGAGGTEDTVFVVRAKLHRNGLELSIRPRSGKLVEHEFPEPPASHVLRRKTDGDGDEPVDLAELPPEERDIAQHMVEPVAEAAWPRDVDLPGSVLVNDQLRAEGKEPAAVSEGATRPSTAGKPKRKRAARPKAAAKK